MNRPYQHLEMITEQFLRGSRPWPNLNVLPVKRWHNGEVELGIILRAAPDFNTENTVFLTNMFAVNIRELDQYVRHSYDSADALIADGWVVD